MKMTTTVAKMNLLFSILILISSNFGSAKLESSPASDLENPEKWLEWYNETATWESASNADANWNYETNITDENLAVSTKSDARILAFQIAAADNASEILKKKGQSLDPKTKRILTKISKVGLRLNDDDAVLYSKLKGNMSAIYSTGTVCAIDEKSMEPDCTKKWQLNPDIEDVLKKNRNYDVLSYVWKSWHENTGRPILPLYEEFVEISNKGARNDGFTDTGDYWRYLYDDPEFKTMLENLWYEVLPLYEQLHTYARKKLKERYPQKFTTSAIPAHIFGNMWAQDWTNIADILTPYPNKTSIDTTTAMKEQNYTTTKMFQIADNFFKSMGLEPLTETFWAKSMIEKPKDGRDVVCHASAWDFYRWNDVRIKMCTKLDMENIIVVHHEQGHIQYYLQYKKQPWSFREGANPGFHEAIGDTIALSVSTPEYLQIIGLMSNYSQDDEQDLNYLFRIASEKIAFLPFGYLIDQWRWTIFNESIPTKEWNQFWWLLRYKYQGMIPPVDRISGKDFDPGAKYHVPANSAYIHYFVAHILQFEFYEAMCKAAGYTGPLHHCNFFNNTVAGDLFGKMLKLGSSMHWKDALEGMVGQRTMSAKPILRYFEPLKKWLEKENKGECFGWGYEWPEEIEKKLSQPRCNP